jgi:hypothetical protein
VRYGWVNKWNRPIDVEHGIVGFSAFEKDVTPELKQGFQNIADAFSGARYSHEDAHIRWYSKMPRRAPRPTSSTVPPPTSSPLTRSNPPTPETGAYDPSETPEEFWDRLGEESRAKPGPSRVTILLPPKRTPD